MKKRILFVAFSILLSLVFSIPAGAHFGMLIPSDSMVMQNENRNVKLNLSFSHPFENVGMELVKPRLFEVIINGKKQNLTAVIKKTSIIGHTAWTLDYRIKRPGIYIFHMEPEPYWEPTENCFIIHYTKTVITAFGDDEGWDREIGLKTEIVPLAKPFGLYAGNVFQGIVKLNQKPVSFAEVEVEYYNKDGRSKAPTDYMVTQTIKADQNGVFTYAAPKEGWWGFAALNTAGYKLKKDGQDKDVELGGVIWIRFHQWK